ncbi:hypothetical protein RO3G_13557 [Rhizopus delemar RA 99-880]|uniref:Uncharacterized protein n=1 Tax=Rhizopus delemar (strain RA 99-880 / ATCC MYA-4621 / FGSC 9543 / NRRL 43880) TaxID=246409 RepID=I1CK66_RHIO9|nr:hypothetical protein RO3G_13557 [Rhizopus delemar RA 99-880]|eukprot:EIE88846.1 hypothetical protein RO3G_13557 [Rhizopus delemar RA 99-880]
MSSNSEGLPVPEMKPSVSINTSRFRRDYDILLKEVLEESSEDEEEDLLNQIDIDLNTATAELPEDLRVALEDRSLAIRYLANLRNFMSHRRSQSVNSITSSKGEYSIPNTPLQSSFNQPLLSPKPFERIDPLSKVLDAIPYQTRLINGVPSLAVLEQRFHTLIIPELDLPSVSDTVIQMNLNELYKLRDDLYIHLNGGLLLNNTNRISKKKKQEIAHLLDDVSKEIGLYEEFIKKGTVVVVFLPVARLLFIFFALHLANYLSLENILNETDSSDIEDNTIDTDSTLLHFVKHLFFFAIEACTYLFMHVQDSPSDTSASKLGDPHLLSSLLPQAPSQHSVTTTNTQNESFTSSDFTINNIPAEPWEAFKWTPLLKLSNQLYSDDIKQSGLISVMTVSGVIAIGTTRSLVFVYDYSQNLICILGDGNKAFEIGAVTSLAVSSDHTTIACGYSQGHIIIWDIRKPMYPIRIIDPLPACQSQSQMQSTSRKEGHVQGASILHIGFAGVKNTEIVSADDQGMAFYHMHYKIIMFNGIHSTRILGRYQRPSANSGRQPKPRKPSTVFAMQHLPLGQTAHPAESFGLVALLTPYKMILVGLKPTPQTLFKFSKPKLLKQQAEDGSKAVVERLSGSLAWLPVLKRGDSSQNDPMLAFAWGNHLFIFQISVESNTTAKASEKARSNTKATKYAVNLEFIQVGEWKCKEPIVSIQWINRQLVYHDWFNTPLKDLVTSPANVAAEPSRENELKSVEMAYFGSIKSYKGKMFLLGLQQIYVGTLLSWTDRIRVLVQAGDILESIELATSFYNGMDIQTVIGLPEEEKARKALVGEKLMELLKASLSYTFSSKRTYNDMANEVGGGETALMRNLARGCIEACLSIGNLEFLFDTVYEHFSDNQVHGVFFEALEPCIIQDRVPDIPPSVMKDLVDHYSKKRLLDELEQVIWHVNPRCLDIDQIVSMCHRDGMYEAMMYVWNKNMHDYVSPLVEMLKVIRLVLRGHSDEQQTLHERQNAEKIYDYLKLILTGRSFPEGSGVTAADEAGEARSAVYSFLFSGRCVVWPPVGGKLILTVDEDETVLEPTYPYLRLLLRFNTKKFLESLAIAFEDPWLNGGEDILSSKFDDEVPGKVISRQIIINTLLDVVGGGLTGNCLPPPRMKQSISASTIQSLATNSRSAPSNLQVNTSVASDHASHFNYFSNDNIILLYIFIASNLHKYTTFILLPPKTLNKVLIRLAEEHDANTHTERERAIQNLLTVFTPTSQEQTVKLYEEAGFWKVLEDVYRQDKKFGKLVETYLKDDERREMVFDCIQDLLTSDLNERQKEDIIRVFMVRISQFVEIDGQKAAEIVQMFGNGDHQDVIRRLEEDEEFDDDEYHATADKRVFSYLHGLLEPYSEIESKSPLNELSNVSGAIQERYVELMCRFDPSGVYNYFSTRLGDNVSLDKMKEICEKHGVMDAVVWVMEKNGNTPGALDKMLKMAKERKETIDQLLESHPSPSIWTFEENERVGCCLMGLNNILRVCTQLCENYWMNTTIRLKCSSGADDQDSSLSEPTLENETSLAGEASRENKEDEDIRKEAEDLWFRLLDAYAEGLVEIHSMFQSGDVLSSAHQRIILSFKSFVQSILTSYLLSASSQTSFIWLLLRVIDSRSRGKTTFDDFKHIFFDMLNSYEHKDKLLKVTDCLFDHDLFVKLQEMASKNEKGWYLDKVACKVCGNSLLDPALLKLSPDWSLEGREAQSSTDKEYNAFDCAANSPMDRLKQQLRQTDKCVACQDENLKDLEADCEEED